MLLLVAIGASAGARAREIKERLRFRRTRRT